MNWNRMIGQLLPNEMKLAVKLRLLLQILTSRTVKDAVAAEQYKNAAKDEHRNIGQTEVVLGLLKDKFSQGITITGQEDGNVKLFGQEAPYVIICGKTSDKAVIVTDVEHADVGCDFVVHVPSEVRADEVRAYVGRFVFAGVGFRVENNNT